MAAAAASAINKRLFVVGGTGYVGSRVVKAALLRGYTVVSLSRNAPAYRSHDNLTYLKGDATRPETYAEDLRQCQASVYCTGELIGWQENPLISSVLAPMLLRGSKEQIRQKLYDESYQKKNKDGALEVGRQMSDFATADGRGHHRQMVYLSAEQNPIFNLVSPAYFSTKREAEQELNDLPGLDVVSVRPGIITAKDEPLRSIAGTLGAPVAGSIDMDTLVSFILNSIESPLRYGQVFSNSQIIA